MADEDSDQSLIRVKVDATGVDVSLGQSVPELIAQLLPGKFRAQRAIRAAMTERIIEKIRNDEEFDEADLAFAESALGDVEQKHIRLRLCQSRSYELYTEGAAMRLIGAGSEGGPEQVNTSAAETSPDWLNKFREDASLVDDEHVREIYSRILAEEARDPLAFSLRTLGALRYMDREVATAFGRLQKVVIDGFVPVNSPDEGRILNRFGLDHSTMLLLDDAGLVTAAIHSNIHYEDEERHILHARGHRRLIGIQLDSGQPFPMDMGPVHLLTPAGAQLARIAETESDEDAFMALAAWITVHAGSVVLTVANVPARGWTGRENADLIWQPLTLPSDIWDTWESE